MVCPSGLDGRQIGASEVLVVSLSLLLPDGFDSTTARLLFVVESKKAQRAARNAQTMHNHLCTQI